MLLVQHRGRCRRFKQRNQFMSCDKSGDRGVLALTIAKTKSTTQTALLLLNRISLMASTWLLWSIKELALPSSARKRKRPMSGWLLETKGGLQHSAKETALFSMKAFLLVLWNNFSFHSTLFGGVSPNPLEAMGCCIGGGFEVPLNFMFLWSNFVFSTLAYSLFISGCNLMRREVFLKNTKNTHQ